MADPVDLGSGIAQGHIDASRSPIRRRDVRRILRGYGAAHTLGKRRGASDKKLYKFATKTVLDWFRKNEKEPKPKGSAPKAPKGGRSGGGSARIQPAPRREPTRLPDTAMRTQPASRREPVRLPDVPEVGTNDIQAAFQRYGIRIPVTSVPRSARMSQEAWAKYLATLRRRYGDLSGGGTGGFRA